MSDQSHCSLAATYSQPRIAKFHHLAAMLMTAESTLFIPGSTRFTAAGDLTKNSN